MSVVEQSLPTGTWQADPIHSSASFRVKHFGVSTFRASFGTIEAAYGTDGLSGSVPVDSISITQPDFRAHVLAEDFFDAEAHPEMSFRSTSLRRHDDGTLHVDGEITVKGVTKAIQATGTASDPSDDPFGGQRFAIELSTTVDRREIGLTWGQKLPNGKLAVEYPVTLEVLLELVRQDG